MFGDSWVDPDFVLANPECAANCTPTEEEPCEPLDKIRAMQACDLVWTRHGRFMVIGLYITVYSLPYVVYTEHVLSVALYQKYLTRLGELIICKLFLLFPQYFQKASFSKSSKVGIMW